MSNILNQGYLFAIEGIDGAGKSTQIQRLCHHYRSKGIEAIALREPTDGPYGRQIREIAKKQRHLFRPEDELALFIQDRIEDCKNNIQPALDRHALVFIDRYYYSNIAYQGALGLSPDLIREKNEAIAIRPDRVFILDLPVDVGLHRIRNFRKEEPDAFEKVDYLKQVRNIFLNMKDDNICRINAVQPEDVIFDQLKNEVDGLIIHHSRALL